MAGKTSSNPNEFLLPDLGEGLEEAELIEWCVSEGQHVNEFDILAKMETDKALVEVPSDRTGVIAMLHGTPGQHVKVHTPLVTFRGEGEDARSSDGNGAHTDVAPIEPEAPHSDVSENADHEVYIEREDAGTVVGSVSGEDYSGEPGKVRAAPAVRRLARDLGVDLERITGTGIGGGRTPSGAPTGPPPPPNHSPPPSPP